jgi:hypothetical protein
MESLAPLLPVAVGLLVAIGFYIAYRSKTRRREAIFAVAARNGWEFSRQDPFDLHRYNFKLFRRGDGRGCDNIVWGQWKGLTFHEADFWYYEESDSDSGGRTRHYRRFSVVLADLPVSVPRLSIGRENMLSWVADKVGFSDIDFESQEFNDAFNVRCEDRAFAFKLIDARFMHWLLSVDKRLGFEVNVETLLVYSKRLEPSELITIIGTAKEFQDHIPRLVRTEYDVAAL